MTRQTKLAAGAVLYAAIAIALVGGVRADADKQVICHATSSETNPWVEIDISVNAGGNNEKAGHFNEEGTPLAGHEEDYIGPCATPAPTVAPTSEPTVEPTVEPTLSPSPTLSPQPTVEPTLTPQPTEPPVRPTPVPTAAPTVVPTPVIVAPSPALTLPPTDTE